MTLLPQLHRKGSGLLLLFLCAVCFTGCRTAAPPLDYRALARASARLHMDIEANDNHRLYLAAAEWMGVPYRGGGDSKRGTDCSGLACQLYRQVYRVRLPRSSAQQMDATRRVARRNLREGDLVFFRSPSSRRVSHVGIYLKNGMFIHASTSRGVIVSSLNESYWDKYWLRGGRRG